MKIKTFRARDMALAMEMVREEMGGEAVILSISRDGERGVKLTVALEEENGFEKADFTRGGLAEKIAGVLKFHRLPEEVLEKIMSRLPSAHESGEALLSALAENFRFSEAPLLSGVKPIMLVGSPGIGKTITASKIAAEAVFAGKTVRLITTDTKKAGGVEQLSAFAAVLGAPLAVCHGPEELKEAAGNAFLGETVVIDTAGANHCNESEIEALVLLAEAVNAEKVLAVPAGADAEEALDAGAAFGKIGCAKMIVTKADAARRFGGALAVALKYRLEMAALSDGPNVASALQKITPAKFVELLFGAVIN